MTTEPARPPALPMAHQPLRQPFVVGPVWAMAAALAVTFGTGSCSDADGIQIQGRLLWANGLPATRIRLRLDTGDNVTYVDSDEEGRYRFVATPPASGALLRGYIPAAVGETSFDIVVESEGPDVEVPTASEWRPFTRVTDDAADLTVMWSPLASDKAPSYSVRVWQEGGDAWWAADELKGPPFALPREVRENHSLSLSLDATIGWCPFFEYVLPRPGAGPQSGACVKERTNGTTSLPLGAARPLSSGGACTARINGVEESLLTLGQPPCPLTDGLAATAMFECPANGCPDAVTVDLGEEIPVGVVVLHGGATDGDSDRSLLVETSTDGISYSTASTYEAEPYPLPAFYARVALDQPVQARFVRLRPASGTFRGLGDVSIF